MTNEYINAAILGVIEGVTEFLPVSSTGHLIIAEKFFSLHPGFSEMFEVVIQFGAILSVLIYFRSTLIPPLIPITREQKDKFREIFFIWFKSGIAVIPALFFGYLFGKKIKEHLFNPGVVAVTLLIGGILLIIIERKKRQHQFDSVTEMPYPTAFITGLIQCLAMIPGTSRSAASIIGAMYLGASRKAAAEFSFFLAIPTMTAASAYSLLKYKPTGMTGEEWTILAIGFAVSFFVAWAVIALFMNYIKTRTFSVFGYYRIFLAIAVIDFFYIYPKIQHAFFR